MSGRTLIYVIAAIIVAFTAIVVKNRMSQEEPVAEAPAPVHRLMIAKRDIMQGTIVQSQDLEWKEVDAEAAKNTAYIYEADATLESFNGAVVRRTLRAGEPVQQNALTRAGDGGFLSAVLEPGMRAVSIAVNATS